MPNGTSLHTHGFLAWPLVSTPLLPACCSVHVDHEIDGQAQAQSETVVPDAQDLGRTWRSWERWACRGPRRTRTRRCAWAPSTVLAWRDDGEPGEGRRDPVAIGSVRRCQMASAVAAKWH